MHGILIFMNKILPPEKVYISSSKIPDGGRGVFARIPIQKGERIEVCPVIQIPESDTSNLGESMLVTYFYYFGKKKERSLVALGYGSIYNHTNTPNALYKEKFKNEVIEFWATKNIEKDEEITVNYNQSSPNEKRPLWVTV